MRIVIFLKTIFFFTIILFFYSCSVSTDSNEEQFDERIVGDWVNYSADDRFPYPVISGIRIQDNGYVMPLAIETATGKLVLESNRPIGIFLKTNRGNIQYQPNWLEIKPDPYNLKYIINDDSLFIDNFLSEYYIRSNVGTQLTDPVNTHLFSIREYQTFSNDTMRDTIQNITINPFPSAYASRDGQNSTFKIIALTNYRGTLIIEITGFNGVGNYNDNSADATFLQDDYDAITVDDTYQDSSFINLDVLYYDGKRCNGKFEIKMNFFSFKNGSFSIPVY